MQKFSSLFIAIVAITLAAYSQAVSQTSGIVNLDNSSTITKSLGMHHSSSPLATVKKIGGKGYSASSASSQDWDWTINVPQTVYCDLFTLYGYGSDSERVQLPWFAAGTETYQALGNYPKSQIDFYKQEGWRLIYKEFGTDSLSVSGYPLFILYNKYRGILRFFFWNAFNGNQKYDYLMVGLTVGGENSTPLFTFYPYTPQFSDQYPANYDYSPEVYSFGNIEQTGWCYADFNLTGFDDQISPKICTLAFQIWGLQGSLSIGNGVPLSQVISGNNDIPGTALNIQIAGDAPVRNAFKEINGLWGLRQEIVDDEDSMSGSWMKAPLGRLAGEASATSASWIGNISSLAGAVDGFIGVQTGNNAANESSCAMPFVFNGTTPLSGTFTPLDFGPLMIPLPGSEANVSSPAEGWQPSYIYPLGIFNVTTEPTVDYCYKVSSYQANSGTLSSYVYGTPYFALDKPIEMVYNPFDGLTLSSATASLVSTSSGPVTAYSNLNAFSDSSYMSAGPIRIKTSSTSGTTPEVGDISDGPQTTVPTEIALNLKFTYYDSLTNKTDTVIFLKTYPVNLQYDPSIADRPLGTMAASGTTASGYGSSSLPQSFVVGNYPNPFNPTTNVEYQLKTTSRVNITVYNSLGQKVAVLTNGLVTAGVHTAVFNGYGFASGVYLLRFEAQPENGGKSIFQTDKMLLIK